MQKVKLTFWRRLQGPTPKFFKKIQKVGLVLSAISGIILAANAEYNLNLPPIVDFIGKIIGYGGFIAAGIASLAVDTDKLKEQGKEPIE